MDSEGEIRGCLTELPEVMREAQMSNRHISELRCGFVLVLHFQCILFPKPLELHLPQCLCTEQSSGVVLFIHFSNRCLLSFVLHF